MKKSWSTQLIWSAIALSVFAVVACGQKKEENNGKPVPSTQKNKINPVTAGTSVTGGTNAVTAGTSGAPVPPADGQPVSSGTGAKPASPTVGTNGGITEGIVNSGTGETANSSVKAIVNKKSILVNFTKFKKSVDDKKEAAHVSFIIGIDGVMVAIETDIKQAELENKEFSVAGDKVFIKGNLRCNSIECGQMSVNVELASSADGKSEVQMGLIKSFEGTLMDPKSKSDQLLIINQLDLTKADVSPVAFDELCLKIGETINNQGL
jgi:hypothetical protein